MIKELTRIIDGKTEDGMEISRLPNKEEIIAKINELVREVNKLEKIK